MSFDSDQVCVFNPCGSEGGTIIVATCFSPNVIEIDNSDSPFDVTSDPGVVILVDTTGGDVTLDLNVTEACPNAKYIIKKVDSSSNKVILNPSGAETVNGAASYSFSRPGEVMRIVRNDNPTPADWVITVEHVVRNKGDLITFNAVTDDTVQFPVGTNNQILTVDLGTPTGLKWSSSFNGPVSGPINADCLSLNVVEIDDTDSPYNTIDDGPAVVILADAGSASVTVNLQSSEDCPTPKYIIKKVDVDESNDITLNPPGSETVNGAASYSFNRCNEVVRVVRNDNVTPADWVVTVEHVVKDKGDLVTFNGDTGRVVRLPVGTNNQILTVDSTTGEGIKWATGVEGPITADCLSLEVVEIDDTDSPFDTSAQPAVVILADATNGPITIALTASVDCPNAKYIIKKVDSSSNDITLDPAGAETVNGAATFAFGRPGEIMRVVRNDNPGTPDWVVSVEHVVRIKGDVVTWDGTAGRAARLPVGVNNQVLTVDDTTDEGIKWASPAGVSGAAGSYHVVTTRVHPLGALNNYTPVGYFAWKQSQYGSITTGKVIFAMDHKGRDIGLRVFNVDTATVLGTSASITADGVYELSFGPMPAADNVLEVQIANTGVGGAVSDLQSAQFEFA